MRVLCVAAHPDDEVLGPGGTLERHRAQGDEVSVLIVYKCRIPPNGGTWLEMFPGEDPKGEIEELVAQLEPEIVYTHHGGDINADHRLVHDGVMVACRPYAAPSVRSIRTFYTASSTEWGTGFTPNLYVDITETYNAKWRAMALYASELRQAPHPRSWDSILTTAQFWGSHVGYEYAEPFVVVREKW